MTEPESALEQLVDDVAWRPDWPGVLARAGVVRRPRLLTRRRVIVAIAVAAAVIIPLAAVAAANDWWFFRTPGSPTPTSAPVVVKTGVWGGHPWQLVAYPSETDGLCVSMVPGAGNGSSYGAALGCGPIEGVARTTQTKPGAPDTAISYLSGGPTAVLPAYIVGPVIEDATTVAIRWSDGTTVRTPTLRVRLLSDTCASTPPRILPRTCPQWSGSRASIRAVTWLPVSLPPPRRTASHRCQPATDDETVLHPLGSAGPAEWRARSLIP